MSVYIENQSGTSFGFHYKVLIEKAVQTVIKDKNIPEELDVNVIIVSPDEIRQINKDNRGIDKETDVLSFPYFEYEQAGIFDIEVQEWADEDILGDIVICADKVLSQAEEYGHSQKRELAFLIVHSMLHLTGYDHMNQEDADVMETEQKKIMEILGLSR